MSVLTTPTSSAARDTGHRPPAVVSLAGLLGLLTIGALQGGLAMVTNPTEPLGITVEYLAKSPVDDYLLPGLFLLGIAAASIITIAGLILGWRWSWASPIESAIGYRWPWLGAVSIGGILLVFEIIELFMVPFHPIMHPLLIAGSLAILILPLTPRARRYLAAE